MEKNTLQQFQAFITNVIIVVVLIYIQLLFDRPLNTLPKLFFITLSLYFIYVGVITAFFQKWIYEKKASGESMWYKPFGVRVIQFLSDKPPLGLKDSYFARLSGLVIVIGGLIIIYLCL